MKVPIYQQKENVEAMQAAQVRPFTPAGDYGANTAGVMKSIVDRIQKLQNDTEDARTLELFNKFKTDSQVYHEDPDKGIYNTRLGYNAQGVYNETDQWLRKTGEEYVKGLKSERAKKNFRNMARDYILQRGKQNSQFEANQIKDYSIKQADANIQLWSDYAGQHYDDAEAVALAENSIMQALELKHRFSGSNKQAIRAEFEDTQDKMNVIRFQQFYAQDKLGAWNAVYEGKLKFRPDTLAKLLARAREDTEIYQIQAYTDHYMKDGSITPENASAVQQRLVNELGADMGWKVFSNINRTWGIQHNEETLKRQEETRRKHDNAMALLTKFNKGEVVTDEEILDADIEETAKHQFLSWNKSMSKEAILEATRQQKKAFDEERDNILLAILNGEPNEDTKKAILHTANIGRLRPEDAKTLINLVDTIINKQNSVDEKEKKEALEAYEKALDIIRSEGGNISDDMARKLLENDKISRQYFNKIINDNQARRKETKTEADKAAKKQMESDSYDIARGLLWENGTEGKALEALENMTDIDIEQRKLIRSSIKAIANDKNIKWKEIQQSAKDMQQQNYNRVLIEILEGQHNQEYINTLLEATSIDNNQWATLKNLIQERDRVKAESEKTAWENDMRIKAQEYFEKYPLGNDDSVHEIIRKEHSGKDADKIIQFYNTFISEQRTERNDKNAAKAERQKTNKENLIRDYYQKMKPLPINTINEMLRNEEISLEGAEELRTFNSALNNRKGVEEYFSKYYSNWNNMTRGEQELAIMRYMGTDENKRKQNVTTLLDKANQGLLHDEEITWYYVNGKISTDDMAELKAYDKKFEREKKGLIEGKKNELLNKFAGVLQRNQNPQLYRALLLNDFYMQVQALDIHAKNFTEQLDQVVSNISISMANELNENFKSNGWFGRNALGKRIDSFVESVTTSSINPNLYQTSINFDTYGNGMQVITSSDDIKPYSDTSNVAEMLAPPPIDETQKQRKVIRNTEAAGVILYPDTDNIPKITDLIQTVNSTSSDKKPVVSHRIGDYGSIIEIASKDYGVEAELIMAVMQIESAGRNGLTSPAGAEGLMQLMPKTAKALGVTNSFDAEQNIRGGTRYLAQMLRRYGGDIEKALWAYNAGPGNADKGKMPRPNETRPYIKNVVSIYNKLKNAQSSQQQRVPQRERPLIVSSDKEQADYVRALLDNTNILSNDNSFNNMMSIFSGKTNWGEY